MKENPKTTPIVRASTFLTVLLLLGGAAVGWLSDAGAKIVGSDSRIQVVGTLPRRDLVEIQRTVRRELWRGVIPQFSWWSIRQLPAAIQARARCSERIFLVTVQAEGTVEVVTSFEVVVGSKVKTLMETGGGIYKLKKGRNGWQVSDRGGFWI